MPPSLGICVVALLVVCAWSPARAEPQDQPKAIDRTDALRVFLDCEACDENYLRTEITFINDVRDRKEADLHVLVTTQPTGGGGTEYTLKFIGLERFAGIEQTLQYVAAQTNTEDETRRGFAQVFKLGLVRYVAETHWHQNSTLRSRLRRRPPQPPPSGIRGISGSFASA
jgi:hypothetical protein